jgi:UDP-N-acetylglucosamine 2-epimerase
MLDQTLYPFEIKLDFDLNIMLPGQSLAQITARAIDGLDQILLKEKPDLVLVQGDTTTAFCGALNAFYRKVKVGHIEAGLRTRDKYAPYPEEMNRRLISQIADYHFAPTKQAKHALISEGVPQNTIHLTGNTVIDALYFIRNKVRNSLPPLPSGLEDFISGKKVILVTGHRRENFGEGIENICGAIREIADIFSDVVFVYPVHLNPNVREPVNRLLGNHKRILLIEPLAYEPFIWLMDQATIVLTDSGGVQEEAPSLGKPVLVTREITERPEGILAGNTQLVGIKKGRIVKELCQLLVSSEKINKMSNINNPYGDGKAAKRIVKVLEKSL